MKISIIIVSYKVKFFLEHCLCSVEKAIDLYQNALTNAPGKKYVAEVFVVDNHSGDNTIEYLQSKFQFARFISNPVNRGFAVANNQALKGASGEYVLFLNPDTIIPEDFFEKSIPVLDTNPTMGAMGFQMIDGNGVFLKESKRGFPRSWASFCKMSGLTAMMPRSKFFSKYYLGHLDKDLNHHVEALSGACMMVRKELLDSIGSFDERFFMYAEDIDLSYRINKAGFSNFYLSEITIIHFKGESTTRDQLYLKQFYKAMLQFVGKHYTGVAGSLYAKLLKTAIAARALFAIGNLHLQKSKLPTGQPKCFLLGDTKSKEEVVTILANQSQIVTDRERANQVILCEGKEFRFAEVIAEMKSAATGNYKIHALGTGAVIGSREVIT